MRKTHPFSVRKVQYRAENKKTAPKSAMLIGNCQYLIFPDGQQKALPQGRA